MSTTLIEMASKIVASQASHSRMSAEEISDAIFKTYDALKKIKALEGDVAGVQGISAAKPRRIKSPLKSIQKNKVVCLECNKEFLQLTNRHLALHNMNSKEYKKKWGIPARQSLAAKSLTNKRRKMALERGLGEKLLQARRKKAQKKGA